MNIIFSVCFCLSVLALTFFSPEKTLSTLLSGGEKALELSLNLIVVYTVWLGIFSIFEKSNLSNKFAKLFKPVNRLLFGSLTEKENEYISLNISANMLGMSGATTPMGIKSILELEKRKNSDYRISMFFVLNATSIQLIPTSVIALRSSLGAQNPSNIIIPTILTTLLSCIIGVILIKIFVKR